MFLMLRDWAYLFTRPPRGFSLFPAFDAVRSYPSNARDHQWIGIEESSDVAPMQAFDSPCRGSACSMLPVSAAYACETGASRTIFREGTSRICRRLARAHPPETFPAFPTFPEAEPGATAKCGECGEWGERNPRKRVVSSVVGGCERSAIPDAGSRCEGESAAGSVCAAIGQRLPGEWRLARRDREVIADDGRRGGGYRPALSSWAGCWR